jgi:hypothetical protein
MNRIEQIRQLVSNGETVYRIAEILKLPLSYVIAVVYYKDRA